MPSFIAKPPYPIYQWPGLAGCKAYLALADTGLKVRDCVNAYEGNLTSELVRTTGLYGRQLGNFSSTRYANIDSLASLSFNTFPCWTTILFVNSGAGGVAAGYGSTTSNQQAIISIEPGYVHYILRGASGFTVDVAAPVDTTNGLPHSTTIVSYSLSVHHLYVDGYLVATISNDLVGISLNNFTIGGYRDSSALNSPFTGSVVVALVGNTVLPHQRSLHDSLYSGLFSAIRQDDTELIAYEVRANKFRNRKSTRRMR